MDEREDGERERGLDRLSHWTSLVSGLVALFREHRRRDHEEQQDEQRARNEDRLEIDSKAVRSARFL